MRPDEPSARNRKAPFSERLEPRSGMVSAETAGTRHRHRGKPRAARYVPAVLIAAAALAVAAWQWHDSRHQLRAIKQELGKRPAETDTQSKESRIVTSRCGSGG
jgi:hypothetical protein